MAKKNSLQIDYLHPCELKDYQRQFRKPTDKQISKTMRLIEECGVTQPIVIDKKNTVVIGWHFVEAARQLDIDSIPVVRANHLSEEQIRILRIAYDRIAEEAEWNKEQMALEFQELEMLIPDLTVTGFEIDEINLTLDILSGSDPGDEVPRVEEGRAITQVGDLWVLGKHKLVCGNALEGSSYQALLGGSLAHMCFTDAPYNVKIDGHVGNSGNIQHREFAMAVGEMSESEFTEFLAKSHKHMMKHSKDGAIIFSCMDWRHIREILDAARTAGLDMINPCVWAKDNGGMGSLYRSKHELVFVFKNGKGQHINNVELGKNGRYRTNVWEYAGVNSFGGGRMDELQMHPTVKPVQMIMDAIKDCSKRGQVILDPFGGSGTTLIASEKTSRKARLIELDPLYCDVIIRRWQELTGQEAIHAETGSTFNETQKQGECNDE